MKRCSHSLLATGWLLLLGLVTPSLLFAVSTDPTSPCGLCYANGADGERIVVPLESTEVLLEVQPGLLEAQITQTFTNRTETALEATYLYPLPSEATLTQFEVHFRDRVIQSVVREKKQARVEYETAKAEGKKAALLEQHDPALFSTAVANFLPGETVRVVIRFIQPVALTATAAEVRFPMTTGAKYFPATSVPGAPGTAAPTPAKVDASSVSSHHYYAFDVLVSGFPASSIESASHRIRVEELPGGRRRVGLAEEITIPDRDFLLRIEPRVVGEPASTVVTQRAGSGSYGMFTVFPPRARQLSGRAALGRDVLFLLDRSGSMNGARLTSAKLGLQGCLSLLETADCFQIVVFDDTHSFYKSTWTPANPAAVAEADTYVGQLQTGGGTEMQPALEAALDFFATKRSEREQIVVFLTDGDVGNAGDLLKLLEAKIGSTRLFTFGIGSAPNAFLIGKMAELGRGQARFINDDKAIARELSELFETLATPVLTGLRLTLVDANDSPVAATVFPRTLRDVFMARPVQAVFAADGAAPVAVLLEAQRDGEIVQVRLPLEGSETRGDGVAKHFGRMLYADLEAQQRAAGIGSAEGAALEQRKLEAALSFQLVTELTSRVAVDRTIARAPDAALVSTTVAQYGAADQPVASPTGAAVAPEEEVIVLSPFEVAADSTSGYCAATTLAGTRLRTELHDIGSAVSVVTAELLKDIGTKRLEEVLPYTNEPMENPAFAHTGVDAGLLNGLPIATVVDFNTVERITVQPVGPTWTELSQIRASYRRERTLEAGIGDGCAANAKLLAAGTGGDDRWAGLAVLSYLRDEHSRWSALLSGRHQFGVGEVEAGAQWRELSGYGRLGLGTATLQLHNDVGTQLRLQAAWHRLDRDDPLQFRRDSATARYDGLGFYNLDLLTAPARKIEDGIVQADVGGSTKAWGRQIWNASLRWHRQTPDFVWQVPVATPVLARDTVQFTAGDQLSTADNKVRLNAHFGWAQQRTQGETEGTRQTLKWAGGANWELGRGLIVFAEAGHEEVLPLVPSGVLRAGSAGWASVSLPVERRRSVQLGGRVELMDGKITGSISVFRERVTNLAYRDWAWEMDHPEALLDGGREWVSPIRYGVSDAFARAGWRTEWNVQPLRNLTATVRWYEDFKNQGPVAGGNHRGSFLMRYDFDRGWMKGFSLGGGFDYRNAVRFGDGVALAGGVNWNLLFGYEVRLFGPERTKVQLTLRNFGGNEYQPTRFSHDRGRQLLLRVSQEF